MCPKRVRNAERGDWVVAYRLHYRHPVKDLAETYSDEDRFWIARQLIDDYHWSVSRAAAALGFNVSRFAQLEDRMEVAS